MHQPKGPRRYHDLHVDQTPTTALDVKSSEQDGNHSPYSWLCSSFFLRYYFLHIWYGHIAEIEILAQFGDVWCSHYESILDRASMCRAQMTSTPFDRN